MITGGSTHPLQAYKLFKMRKIAMVTTEERSKHAILQLEDEIASCMFVIAPAKASELGRFVEEHDLSIVFTEDKGFTIRVNLVSHEIMLPIGALNYLWCSTYLFYQLYQSYVAAQGAGVKVLDTSQTGCNDAIDLFNWARNSLRTNELKWPEDSPRPKLGKPQGDDSIRITDEIFLCGLAWVLHHERAHIELEHLGSAPLEDVRLETDADNSATKWVLDSCNSDLERQKRALGIATATLAMALLDDPHRPQPPVTTHPSSPERLYANLQIAGLPPDNIVFSFSLVVLQFCIGQYTNAPSADANVGTFDEYLGDFLAIYATRHRG
jgi:hypothetical protein